jgi:hypothetical protein
MKLVGYILVFSLIGGVFGFIAGMGESRYYKKSQQDFAFPLLSILGLVGGGIIGVYLGIKVDGEEKENKKYGFETLETFEGKNGRKWFFETRWINPITGETNKIFTGFNKQQDSVMTSFNDNRIEVHDTTSGSKDVVRKIHMEAVVKIKKSIKTSDYSQI